MMYQTPPPADAKTGLMLQPASSWSGATVLPASKKAAIEIGKRLAALRKARGVTQVELAEALGIAQANMSDYERGRLRLHGELIQQITHYLDVSADELLGTGAHNGKAGTGGPQRATRSKRLRERLEQIEALPKRDRDALLRTINTFLANAPEAPQRTQERRGESG